MNSKKIFDQVDLSELCSEVVDNVNDRDGVSIYDVMKFDKSMADIWEALKRVGIHLDSRKVSGCMFSKQMGLYDMVIDLINRDIDEVIFID